MSAEIRELILEGYTARRESRSDRARDLFSSATALAIDAGDKDLQVDALRGWANSESDLGDLEAAAERYHEAITLLREMDDPLRLAQTVRHLGDVTRKQKRMEMAVGCYNEAIGIYRSNEGTLPLDLANALRGYGLLREDLGDLAAARLVWDEVLKLYTEAGVQPGIDEAERRLHALATTVP